jgi:hypothetical protein
MIKECNTYSLPDAKNAKNAKNALIFRNNCHRQYRVQKLWRYIRVNRQFFENKTT